MRKLLGSLVLLLVAFGAQATPITFTFSGTGSGSFDQVAFSDAAFNIQIFGDTNDVLDPAQNLDLTANLTSLVTVSGVGQGSFTDSLFVFGGAGEDYLGFGTVFSNGNLIAFFNPDNSLTAFDLKSNFGPIVEVNDNLNQFVNAATTAGDLTFDTMSPVTFTAQLDTTQVPEPGTLALLGLGLLGVGCSKRRAKF